MKSRGKSHPAGDAGGFVCIWWLDFGFEFGKPALVLGMLAIVLAALGLLGARAIVQERRDAAAANWPGGAESIYAGPAAPNYGQPMSAAMKLRLARFGIPLHIGPRGVPLLEDRRTGAVREAIELELTFPETAATVRQGLNPDAAAAPGPGGGAVSWLEPDGFQELPEAIPVDRVSWFVVQESRRGRGKGFDSGRGADHGRRPPTLGRRVGPELAAIAQALADKYA